MNKDHSHSWVRISHGLNKLVTNLNNKEQDDNKQETSEMQFEDCALKSNARAFASRSKAKAKPQRRISASSSTRTFPFGGKNLDWCWTRKIFTDYSVSKKLINLLRHGSLHREDDGAIEFWREKDYLQNHFVHSRHWSDEKWKSIMARGGGRNKKRFQYCSDSSGEILYLRALQGHSGRNLIHPSLQDNVLILDDFFKYIHHVGCAINLHSIINSGLIPEGQNLSKRQTVFFLPVSPMDKEHKDPETIDLEAPRLARCMHKAWKKHQNTMYCRHQTCSKERIKVLSNAIERHHPLKYTPSLLYLESCSDGHWRNHIRKTIWTTSTACEGFLEKWLDEGIGFRSCSTSRRRPTNPTES